MKRPKSGKPRKQRKFLFKAPLHLRQNFLHVHLNKELKQKYKKRSLRVRKGDVVKVIKGKFKGKTGKVIGVDLERMFVYIEGITRKPNRKEKAEKPIPLRPSNLEIVTLDLSDKKRSKVLNG
jgi:large subunit ribosomal protein L24